MSPPRHARLFKNGRNQAVRIPKEFELPGTEALVYKDGHRLVLEPIARPSLKSLLESWQPLDIDWPDFDDPAPEPVKLGHQ